MASFQERFQIVLTDKLKKNLKEAAAKIDVSMSELSRIAIRELCQKILTDDEYAARLRSNYEE